MRYLVITDLDGTLLDHQSYDFTAAEEAIRALAKREIPLILNSSKTQAEITSIRQQLNNHEPFVCENGGIICGMGKQRYLGTPRAEFIAELSLIKQKLNLNYQGFAEATVEDVVRWTGLNPQNAQQAMERHVTEPLWWQDSDTALARFRQELQQLELQCVQGGRFYHVMGMFNKASCFAQLKQYYLKMWQEDIRIIALGDSPNDLPMLEQADYAVVIPTAKKEILKPHNPLVYFASQLAPHGWQEGINFLVKTWL